MSHQSCLEQPVLEHVIKPVSSDTLQDSSQSPNTDSNKFVTTVECLGNFCIRQIEALKKFVHLFWLMLVATFRPPFRFRQLLIAMEFVGFGSMFIILLAGFSCGAILAYQCAYAFGIFGAEAMTGATVALALCRELGPVLTAIMVAGRASSGMATVIGTMRVTEQIDAMKTMAVDPVQYLIVPRVWGTVLMMPVLTAVMDFIGIIAAYVIGVMLSGVDFGAFEAMIDGMLRPFDVYGGLIKAAFFGILVSFLGCYKGYYADGGAKGVGEATTDAVVYASISVLILDYFLTMILW